MARLLAFTRSPRFGGDDAVLLELIRAWPAGDRWIVVVNRNHAGWAVYQEALAGRAELLPAARSTLGLRKTFAAACPDAVLVSSGGFPPIAPTVAALIAARLAGAPRLVLAVHNDPNPGAGPRALWRGARGRLAARLADAVISVSRDCAGKVAAACGRPVRAILNGAGPLQDADPAALRRELGVPAGVPLIGAIGHLEARKGFRVLLEAFRLLAPRRPDARLAVIGAPIEPEEDAALRALAADPAVAGRATLVGYKPRARRFAAAFDVCVVPSLRSESFGLVALDAMRAGRPVVASRVGGLPEVVADGETGLLAPPGDAAALARALEELLADPAKARRLGEAGRRRAAARFSAERMAAEYREVLLGGQMITSRR
ncbi:MAG: glycosyltransferase family 4 protein [Elusimicrobia bacterium]|nr:glycosyltransferase family 4 protein [Elusimicrobiota bacterium]